MPGDWPFPPPGGPKPPKKKRPTPDEFGEAPFMEA